jgi:hypothetical protein
VDRALSIFNWFLGDNDLRIPVYDTTTGGCHDGLHPQGVNENQGAESMLSWLGSLLALYEYRQSTTQESDKSISERATFKPADANHTPIPG